jgi:transcriptional regulator with XRE-family HTH domain
MTDTREQIAQPLARQRADFLRNCRARIKPSDVGLPDPKRRRTEGVRRGDVAALSGISVAWYTWLEQGREIRVSDDVLERICQTFRLTGDERVYLFSLVQQRAPRVQAEPECAVPESIERLVTGMAVPCIAMNVRWDILGWNELSRRLYRDYAQLPAPRRNLAEMMFLHADRQGDLVDPENTAQRLIAKLKVDYSTYGRDPRFEAMIQRLERSSPLFRTMWRSPDFNVGSYGVHRFQHRVYGELAFEHTSCLPDGHPTLRVVMCMPADARSREVVAQLCREAS